MKSILTCLTILFALALQGQASHPWVKKFQKEGVTIWTRGEKTSEYKATMTVDADINACVALLQDIDVHPSFMGSVKSTKLLKTYNNKESLVYFVIDMPFPMKDMDLVSRATFNYLPDKERVVVDINCEPDQAPKTTYERMKKADGFWSFQRQKDGKTHVTYQLAFEPSNAPNWLVEMFLLDNPKKIMSGFAQLVTQTKYKNKDIAWIN
ncbi:MAG: hypothetical protein KDC49_03390 [Saprospiraceae bacterium]|nr:hypothetical protein [Saprospiraceae bacterium]